MEVEASSLIPKVVRNLNTNKISDVGVDCWAGPLAINPNDWPQSSAIGVSVDPANTPIKIDKTSESCGKD